MSPQVTARKLALLKTYLQDLRSFEKTVRENHYAVERLIQLIVESMMDILLHRLASTGVVGPETYAEVVVQAGEHGLISRELADSLRLAGRMRNLLVHGYEGIDLTKMEQALPIIFRDGERFVREVGQWSWAGDETDR